MARSGIEIEVEGRNKGIRIPIGGVEGGIEEKSIHTADKDEAVEERRDRGSEQIQRGEVDSRVSNAT
jgi:hypothetical protein